MFDITQLIGSLSRHAAARPSRRGLTRKVLSFTGFSQLTMAAAPRPVVTWRVTRSCNFNCLSCLDDSRPQRYESELTTHEGLALIRDLGAFQVPRLLFAGGEPLMRADLLELVAYASELGIEPAIFTNGTLLSPALAVGLKRAGLQTISILPDGIGPQVDHNRGLRGAFNAVMEGYANCEAAGIAAEIRTPLNRWIYPELAGILDFVERMKIRRVVFAHLVYTGRGANPQDDLTHEEKRHALDLLLDRAEDFHRRGVQIQIATDENHVDGIYRYLRLAQKNPLQAPLASAVLAEGGASISGAGVGVAGINSVGDVHPDPYWSNYVLGNVRETAFSEIWESSSDPLLRGLRNRLPLLKGRCGNCRWKQACGGNLRVRAEEYFGDPWMSDPACYLVNSEISKGITHQVEAMEDDVLLSEQAA